MAKFFSGLRLIRVLLVSFVAFSFAAPACAWAVIVLGEDAPTFEEKDLQGELQSLPEYRGKVCVLYFWAVWCPACRREVPNIQKVYESFRSKGVRFIGISLDQNLESLKKYVADNRIAYPVIFKGKAWDNELAALYDVRSTPTFYVVGKKGKFLAAGNWSDELRQVLDKVVR